MKVYCPRCKVDWAQPENQTVHWPGCHRTFASLYAFDAHQSIDDGAVTCTAPDLLKSRDRAPRFRPRMDAEGAWVWHSTKVDERWDGSSV